MAIELTKFQLQFLEFCCVQHLGEVVLLRRAPLDRGGAELLRLAPGLFE